MLGQTPLYLKLEPQEEVQIIIEMAGYIQEKTTIDKNSPQNIKILLKPTNPAQHISASDPEIKSKTSSKKNLYISSSIAVISGLASFYFRKQGDKAYEKYLAQGEPSAIKKYYDRAEMYDTYSAISFGAFQLSFLTSAYLFIKNKSL